MLMLRAFAWNERCADHLRELVGKRDVGLLERAGLDCAEAAVRAGSDLREPGVCRGGELICHPGVAGLARRVLFVTVGLLTSYFC